MISSERQLATLELNVRKQLDDITVNNQGQLTAILNREYPHKVSADSRFAYLNDVCCGALVFRKSSELILDSLIVLPAYQNWGIEDLLWSHVLKIASNKSIKIYTNNADWFIQRDAKLMGEAECWFGPGSELLLTPK